MLEQGILVGERYEIVDMIGSGGMADVYKAKDHKLNRFVAVKVLKAEFKDDKTFVSKFRTEAQSAAGLSHPNIVNVFDVGDENGIYFIVMELIEGITLKDYIEKKGKLSIKEAISIAIQVSMGLECAHNNHIIHRDIKPQNIIISTDGKVKVTDFGIARAASSNTISSNVMGSVHYSSPEQARGGYSDEKSDIYSLGITMYEMVTGKVPFDGETTVAIAIKHLQEEMVSPKNYTPELPFAVEQIIFKCTQKSADRRYMNLEELIKDLKQSLVNPDGDFVQLLPLNNHAKTVMISKEELEQIKNERNRGFTEDEEEPAEEEPEDDDEESETEDYYEDEDDDEDEEDDEDEDGYISPKLEKIMTIGGVIVVIIIFAVLVFLVGNAMGFFNFGSSFRNRPEQTESESVDESETESDEEDEDLVVVPDLRGKTFDQAQAELNGLGLGIKRSSDSPQASDSYESGQIMSQGTPANEKVAKHTQIEVVISSGAGSVTVPPVNGMTQTEAEAELQKVGLVTKVTRQESSDVPSGSVISTSPGGGSSVPAGSTVTLVISEGVNIQTVTVPNVLGLSESTAKSMLGDSFQITVSNDYSDDYPEGEVCLQSLTAGSEVALNTSITLVVSMGSRPVETEPPQTTSWVSEYTLEEPANYNGGKVRLVLSQSGMDDKELVAKANVKFPYNVSGYSSSTGDTGILTVSEFDEEDNEIILGTYTVPFEAAN